MEEDILNYSPIVMFRGTPYICFFGNRQLIIEILIYHLHFVQSKLFLKLSKNATQKHMLLTFHFTILFI